MFYIVTWYACASAVDWTVHALFMHRGWNKGLADIHSVHHISAMNKDNTTHGEWFSWTVVMMYTLGTFPMALLLPWWWMHPLLITVLMGVHNYSHSHYHHHTPPSLWDAPVFTVPSSVTQILHDHHALHHQEPNCNFCTVALGWDWVAGTERKHRISG